MDNTLGGFLQSRRARIQPEDVGLPPYGRRRVPGLRREEVAQLAGVSVDYYIRLEQGRGKHVSDAVLDAVARVLRLDTTEQAHLRDLARPDRTQAAAAPRAPARHIRPGVRMLLDNLHGAPAFVLGRRMDVLAWNAVGDAVHGFSAAAEGTGYATPESANNMPTRVFLDPQAGAVYLDWAAVAAETVAYLRLRSGQHPDDEELNALIAELSAKSADFRRLWADHLVKQKTYGVKRMNHPVAGRLDFGYETLALPGDAELTMLVYTVPPGSATAERLAVLASWSAGTPIGPAAGRR